MSEKVMLSLVEESTWGEVPPCLPAGMMYRKAAPFGPVALSLANEATEFSFRCCCGGRVAGSCEPGKIACGVPCPGCDKTYTVEMDADARLRS